jgi:pimeloyl-ACP methyl ester carboxylesterase
VAFREGFVEADGFRIRVMEAGEGTPLVYLHGGGGLRLSRTHELLSRRNRVIAFEMPGFGESPENVRSQSVREMALTMAAAIAALGVEKFNLMGTSFGGRVALWLASLRPEQVRALVLEAPAALGLIAGKPPWEYTPAELASYLFAHPERIDTLPPVNPTAQSKVRDLLRRLMVPPRDAELEARMREIATPTLVMFGTLDRMVPPDRGRLYKELLPNCHLVFIYDAGHLANIERPEAVAAVTEDFLEHGEAFVISRAETVIHS